jgi:TRAP-type C4-dicarboxylate transport system substrate-binding protein
VSSYTSPTENTFWFMFEPLIISTESMEKLCTDQQDAVRAVGEELQDFAYTASEEDDTKVEGVFSDAGVEVVTMDDAAFDEWQKLAEKQWEAYAKSAPNGRELLDLAKEAAKE